MDFLQINEEFDTRMFSSCSHVNAKYVFGFKK